jgi:hypothetical protein
MKGPLVPYQVLSPEMGLIFAVVTGMLFGFFLERAGFGSPKKLTAIFYFKDFAVLRVMFTAVVVGVLGILALEEMGWVEPARVAVPPTYFWPQALGGLLIGIGFAAGGY